jgi:hypothetical protein
VERAITIIIIFGYSRLSSDASLAARAPISSTDGTEKLTLN